MTFPNFQNQENEPLLNKSLGYGVDVGNMQSIQIISTPRTGSSAMGQLLSDSGLEQIRLGEVENQSALEFNSGGYFEDSTLNLCLDNLIRFTHGLRNSFIFNQGMEPDRDRMFSNLALHHDSSYDLDEKSVELPNGYTQRLSDYTGHNWDVWGLTRMSQGKKWFRAYSRAGVETGKKAFDKFIELNRKMKLGQHTFIKDPRLVYLLPLLDHSVPTILVKRKPEHILKSMKNHYGPNLFTKKILQSDWVSNHFNYKIQPQDFDEFYSIYLLFENYARDNMDVTEIAYESLRDKKELLKMSRFIGVQLSWKEPR